MKKVLLCFIATFSLITIGVAQEKINYIIVKTVNGEITSFNPSSISRLYIENQNWIFELKENGKKYSYPLQDILPFTTELRSVTAIQSVSLPNWNVYDEGNSLVIINPSGAVGRFTVHDINGRLIKQGHTSDNKVVISIVPKGLYIVNADGKAKKVIKK